MERIAQDTKLTGVERIVGSGTGTIDFELGNGELYIWDGAEDADWSVKNIDYIENGAEDRIVMHPEGEHFVCEISADGEEYNEGPVRCWCE